MGKFFGIISQVKSNIMSILPNYVLACISTVFLLYSFINIKIKKIKISNVYTYGLGIIFAVLLLEIPIYGILCNSPLGQVQILIENILK